MSVAGDAGWPLACSGERYCTVPMTWPVAVSGTWSVMRAMPKSVIFTRPSGVTSRLPGLMSRCTRPAACAACSAIAVCDDDVEHAVGRQGVLALEDRGERLARDELHDEEGGAVLLAVVVDVRDALVVHERRVAGLGAEALEEPGVAEVLVLEDLDGDGSADDEVGGLPHLAHAADRRCARRARSGPRR